MALIKNGRLTEDAWTEVADDAPLPVDGPIIVSLARWNADRDALLSLKRPLGLRLDNDRSPEPIEGDVGHFSLIVLHFPKFTDGRAYSQAHLLRQRYGFAGELRATGQVLRDQLALMLRCGFDSFETGDRRAIDGWTQAAHEISIRYQPAADGQNSAWDMRRRRTAALAAAAGGIGATRTPEPIAAPADPEPAHEPAL